MYPRRFESRKTGRSGYAPACANEWVRGVCEKPRIKCAECLNRRFLPITDDVIRWHHLADPIAYRRDRRKDQLLQERGYFVLRVLAEDVAKDLNAVLDGILRALARRSQWTAKPEPLRFIRHGTD